MYRYETHLHTSPVSKCASASPEEAVDFYKSNGYDGIFVTNHFIDGNIAVDLSTPYKEKIEFYCSDYEKAFEYGKKIGFKVFFGFEVSCGGTDFLVYGLDKKWLLEHPEIENMDIVEKLNLYKSSGAFVVQAHPFREADYIKYIRLLPRCINGVEIINASRIDFENDMAKLYCERYKLLPFAGSDDHCAGKNRRQWAGVEFSEPLRNEADFVKRIFEGQARVFVVRKDG